MKIVYDALNNFFIKETFLQFQGIKNVIIDLGISV